MRRRFLIIAATFVSAGLSVPAAACTLPSVLYFEHGSAAITPQSERALTILVGWAKRRGDGLEAITVTGFSDRTGSQSSRLAISSARAQQVRSWLTRAGMPAELIVARGLGDRVLAVQTQDGVPEADNRRVEISVTLSEAGQAELRQSTQTQIGQIVTCG